MKNKNSFKTLSKYLVSHTNHLLVKVYIIKNLNQYPSSLHTGLSITSSFLSFSPSVCKIQLSMHFSVCLYIMHIYRQSERCINTWISPTLGDGDKNVNMILKPVWRGGGYWSRLYGIRH